MNSVKEWTELWIINFLSRPWNSGIRIPEEYFPTFAHDSFSRVRMRAMIAVLIEWELGVLSQVISRCVMCCVWTSVTHTGQDDTHTRQNDTPRQDDTYQIRWHTPEKVTQSEHYDTHRTRWHKPDNVTHTGQGGTPNMMIYTKQGDTQKKVIQNRQGDTLVKVTHTGQGYTPDKMTHTIQADTPDKVAHTGKGDTHWTRWPTEKGDTLDKVTYTRQGDTNQTRLQTEQGDTHQSRQHTRKNYRQRTRGHTGQGDKHTGQGNRHQKGDTHRTRWHTGWDVLCEKDNKERRNKVVNSLNIATSRMAYCPDVEYSFEDLSQDIQTV